MSGWMAAGQIGASLVGSWLGYKGQQEANDTNENIARETREWNSAEAVKSRDWQEQMRRTQYQTTVQDLQAAGLNPMLAYQQGGAGTPSGAQASMSSLPQIGNKAAAALTAGAAAAQIAYTHAQTDKTAAETDVAHATAKQVEAQTHLTTASTENVVQTTQQVKENIAQIQQNIKYVREQTLSEVQRQGLYAAQAGLTAVQQQVENKRIELTEAQTKVQQIMAKLQSLEIPGATNKSTSDQTWWGRNVRPYLRDAGTLTNSAQGATNSIYQLRR